MSHDFVRGKSVAETTGAMPAHGRLVHNFGCVLRCQWEYSLQAHIAAAWLCRSISSYEEVTLYFGNSTIISFDDLASYIRRLRADNTFDDVSDKGRHERGFMKFWQNLVYPLRECGANRFICLFLVKTQRVICLFLLHLKTMFSFLRCKDCYDITDTITIVRLHLH